MDPRTPVNSRSIRNIIVIFAFMLLLPVPGWAQAVFGVSSVPRTVVKTGHTELVGAVLFAVNSGTTVADSLQITLSPAVVTGLSTGILITGTGALAAASVISLVADSGVLVISIPGGAGPGSILSISGIRVSAPSLATTILDARFGLTSNFIAANQSSARVVSGVVDGLVVDPASDNSFTISAVGVFDALGSFILSEGTIDAFSSAVGTLGQTQASQVVFRLIGLPDGVSVTFPATVTGSSGATLSTLNGLAETVTNQTTPTRMVYVFADSPSGATALESFTVNPTINLSTTWGIGTVVLQASLSPIGAATPTASFPSNAIPRFAEQFVPSIAGGVIITKSMVFPISSADTDARVVVANVSSGAALLTVRARQSDGTILAGPSVLNDVSVNVLGRQTAPLIMSQLFGTTVNPASVASVEIESPSSRVVGSSLDRTAGGSYVLPFMDEATTLYLPFDRKTSAEIPVLTVQNAKQTVNLTLTLRSSTGQGLATSSRSLMPSETLRGPLTTLFGLQPGGFALNGYVLVAADTPIRASLVNHPDAGTESVFGSAALGQLRTPIPFFAFGGPYKASISLINGSPSGRARFTLTPFQPSGAPLSGTTPVSTEVGPGERMDVDLGRAFGTDLTRLVTGYLLMDVDALSPGNPFSGPPPVAALVHIAAANALAVFPVVNNSGSELFFTPTTDTTADYTGLAILNAGSTATDVTVELTAPDGVSRGSATFNLAPAVMRVQLLREFFTNSVPHQDGTVRISSSPVPVYAVAFRGSLALSDLLYLHAQVAR